MEFHCHIFICRMPDCILLHFVEGLKSAAFSDTKFNGADGSMYSATQFIRYSRNPNHFTCWTKETRGMWANSGLMTDFPVVSLKWSEVGSYDTEGNNPGETLFAWGSISHQGNVSQRRNRMFTFISLGQVSIWISGGKTIASGKCIVSLANWAKSTELGSSKPD